MKTISRLTLSLITAVIMLFATSPFSLAQAMGSIQGHANNPLSQPLVDYSVKLSLSSQATSDDKLRKYATSFPTDQSGNFSGTGIAPNEYIAFLIDNKTGKPVDIIEHVNIKAGEKVTVNFDMTRKEYMDKMTPEEKAQLEDFRKKNAATMAANSKVANLNAMLASSNADITAGNPDSAVTKMQTATQAKPDEPILWLTLGRAEQASGDLAYANAKKAGTPTTDPSIQQKYDEAVAAYQKGIDLNMALKKPMPQDLGFAYNQLGQIDGKLGKYKEASDAYDMAAKAMPANAGTYFYNEAATLLNSGKSDEAAIAADKAIAADPNRPDTYYIKGQALIQKATVDEKTQKITAPPGCVEAYQKYLELAPTGAHAQEVKDVLSGIGATVVSGYKAPPAKKK